MSKFTFDEAAYENALIELFEKELGYTYFNGFALERDISEPLLLENVYAKLEDINGGIYRAAIQEAVLKVRHFASRNTLASNEQFMDYLQNGVEVTYEEQGKQKNAIIKLVDFENVDRNEFLIVNQFTVQENAKKRPDIVLFVNGFPLVYMELKSCSREETDASEAYRQTRNCILDIPSFFNYNALCVISDMTTNKIGTITAGEDRFMEWKSKSGDYEETRYASFETLFCGVFEKARFLDIIKNYIMYVHDDSSTFKVVSGYHQYFAVNKALASTQRAIATTRKAGVVWHTQGSGKSYSMVFYARMIAKALTKATIVVLTDRNDLDDQLYQTFGYCAKFLRQTPIQAKDREDLTDKLKNRAVGGIIFTTMQKFEEGESCLSDRDDIILIVDEAHRSQYGLEEKVDKDGKIVVGYARLVRLSLPKATFIGFTGTPIDENDRNTKATFGNYIDIYDITQAVLDNATKPIYYESRVMKLSLDEDTLKTIDAEYDKLSEHAESMHIEKSKKELAKLDSIIGTDKAITTLTKDMLAHYKDREHLLTGKAMIVAYSRSIAMKIYDEIILHEPSYTGKVKIVMTSNNDDPENWKKIIGTKADKKNLVKEFKDNKSDFKLAIVVDMWLTGFDVPSLATMYVFKPMKGHDLMQAIARVNRVFKDKEGGLIVDYIGIAAALKLAMKQYTARDYKNFGDNDISTKALPKFEEKLSICRDFMHGIDYGKFISGSDLDRSRLIVAGINHIVGNEQEKEKFLREALGLHQALGLCLSLVEYPERMEAAFFEAVRVAITRISTSGKKLSLRDINDRINELLKQSIKDSKVVNIFGDDKIEFSIFDDKYLESLAKMPEKNLAVELLRRLLEDEIKVYQRTNLVKSELFSEKMQRIMNSYVNGQLTNAEVLEELRKMAEEMKTDSDVAAKYGFSKEEMAFYDAITKPQAIKDFYGEENENLIAIVKELTDALNKNRTIDWQTKGTARSGMRMIVKKLLKKYKYPPDETVETIELVIKQAEKFADNIEE